MSKTFAIAIDGPVASGKGTLAAKLAKKLGATYIYTGAMYRALALLCIRNKVDPHSEEEVLQVLTSNSIELREPNKERDTFSVWLNNQDVMESIHSKEVEDAVPIIATFSSVRKEMVKVWQKLAQGKNVVMEGRDITTKVLPDADLKLFLTASLEERARRRHAQFRERGDERTLAQIEQEIKERDRQDSERGVSPLMVGRDTIVLDTTSLSIDQTVEAVYALAKKAGII